MKTECSYSNFFSSGLRAIIGRSRKRPTSMPSLPNPVGFDASIHSLSSTPPVSAKKSSRIRPMSLILPIISTPQHPTTPRSRRSSLITFPSRLVDRVTSTPSHAPAILARKSTLPKTSSGLRRDSTSDITEVWITKGGPFIPSEVQTIDPFASSPDAKSFFIDLSETPSMTPIRESFLSFSSKDSSIFHLPRRERPTSIQTMPLPPRSRRSSAQYRPPSQDKYDLAWMLDEASPIIPWTNEGLKEVEEEFDASKVDWREFHLDLLRDEPLV